MKPPSAFPTRSVRRVGRPLVFTAVVAAIIIPAITGCQTSVGGQTLPSAYYLRDDIQYYPAGPEFLLSNQVRAIERYKAERGELNEAGS